MTDHSKSQNTFGSIGYPKWMAAVDAQNSDSLKHPCEYWVYNLFIVQEQLYFDTPSEVQVKWASVMQDMKNHKFEHVLAQSKSGTGKTLGFLGLAAALLESNSEITNDLSDQTTLYPKILVLAPTREIAIQINDFANLVLGSFPAPKSVSVCSVPAIGGIAMNESKASLMLDKPVLLWGTLGRILHMIERKYLNLSKLRMVILDEADQLCKSNFTDKAFKQLKKIVAKFPNQTDWVPVNSFQICAFSATFWKDSERYITQTLMKGQKFKEFRISSDIVPSKAIDKDWPNNIKEFYIEESELLSFIDNKSIKSVNEQKCQAIIKILMKLNYNQAIIFYNKKMKGQEIESALRGMSLSIYSNYF